MEETREKIELFRNYYFVCFRGFDQDPYSPTHLEPLNMYIIVFREGILSVRSFYCSKSCLAITRSFLVPLSSDTTSSECPPPYQAAQRLYQRRLRLDFIRPH